MDVKCAGKLPLKPRNRVGSDSFIRCSETLRPDLKVDISFGKKSFPTSRPSSNWIFPPGTNWKLSVVMFSYPSFFLTSSALSSFKHSYLVLSFFLDSCNLINCISKWQEIASLLRVDPTWIISLLIPLALCVST